MKLHTILLGLLAATGAFAQTLTLDEAERIGFENSLNVKIAQSRLRKAQQQSKQALAQLGFRLDGSGLYERYIPARPTGFGDPSVDAKRASLALSYPLDLGGVGRKAAQAAKANEDATSEGINVETLQLKLDIRSAYFSVLRSAWNVEVQREALQATTARMENAQKLFVQGAIARFDILRLETDVQRATSALTEAENGLALAKQILNNTMSRDVDTPVELDPQEISMRGFETPEMALEEGRLLAVAIENRPELRQLANQLRAQEFFTLTERGGLTPSLNLQALYTYTFDANAFNKPNQVTLAANLSFPLFDNGLTRARILAAKEDEVQIRLTQDRTRLGIGLDVKSAITRVRNAVSQMGFATKTVQLQTEALRLAELRYTSGEGILLDVTTADADLRAAQGALVSARAEYLTAIAALRKAIGTDNLPTATGTTEPRS